MSSKTLLNASVKAALSCAAIVVITTAQTTLPVMTNLSDNVDYTDRAWINLMNQARPWLAKNTISLNFTSGCPIDSFQLDTNGYPLDLPKTIRGYAEPQGLMAILPNVSYPAGNYVMLYEGEGDMYIYRAQNIVKSPGRWTFYYPGGIWELGITRTAAATHIRNIRIVSAAAENTDYTNHPFLPEYLDVIKKFHAVRFIAWEQANCSPEKTWSKRIRPTYYTQQLASIERQVDLCNEANVDMWYLVPYQADDEFMDKCAAVIKSRLKPTLKLYLEYSNECWNWSAGFCQFSWINGNNGVGAAAGAADSIRNAILAIWQGGGGHPETYGYMADRTFKHFMAVWTGADQQRVVRVVSGQAGWLDITDRAVAKAKSLGGCDAVAVAPYFSLSDAAHSRFCSAAAGSVTVNMVMDSMNAQADRDISGSSGSICDLPDNAAIARKYNVDLLFYEVGPDFGYLGCTFSGALNDTILAASRSQRMYDVYTKHIRASAASAIGCKLYGSFILYGEQHHYAHLDSVGQIQAYPFAQLPAKWRAIMDGNTPRPASAVVSRSAQAGASSKNAVQFAPRMLIGGGTRQNAAGTVYNLHGRRIAAFRNMTKADGVFISGRRIRAGASQ